MTTYPVLSGLGRLGPTTATHLASVIGVDRSATTRYASKLEATVWFTARSTQGTPAPLGSH